MHGSLQLNGRKHGKKRAALKTTKLHDPLPVFDARLEEDSVSHSLGLKCQKLVKMKMLPENNHTSLTLVSLLFGCL